MDQSFSLSSLLLFMKLSKSFEFTKDRTNSLSLFKNSSRLLQVIRYAKLRPVKAIVLLGGEDFFSNGMNLNTIEASDRPADESWRNINALDDVCEEILTTLDKLTVAGIRGNAGAGGVFLALTCDMVFARYRSKTQSHKDFQCFCNEG